jgi:DNA-binding transcriptional ArsR family regulator
VKEFGHNRDTRPHSETLGLGERLHDLALEKMITQQKGELSMSVPIEKALAYLDALEADRRAALALSEQKAEEARLIKARQEGFQAAMEMLGWAIPARKAVPDHERPARRRMRRDIAQLILRELSFSGEAMTTIQIAKAIDYHPERTEASLKRLEEAGQVLRNGEGRWAVALTGRTAQPALRAVATINEVSSVPSVIGVRASKQATKQATSAAS